jgi:hypothetical protein
MGQRQLTKIEAAVAEIFMAAHDGANLCCTVAALNTDGLVVSIDVMADAINISPYPYGDEPLARLQMSGALDELAGMELENVDWDANGFATVGIGGNAVADVARLVERTFTRLLRCDEATYAVATSTKDLGPS